MTTPRLRSHNTYQEGVFGRSMVQRVNILFEDDIWQKLKQVPSGERSKVVNEAVSEWLLRQQRLEAAAEMDRLKSKTKQIDSNEILEMLRQDRRRSK